MTGTSALNWNHIPVKFTKISMEFRDPLEILADYATWDWGVTRVSAGYSLYPFVLTCLAVLYPQAKGLNNRVDRNVKKIFVILIFVCPWLNRVRTTDGGCPFGQDQDHRVHTFGYGLHLYLWIQITAEIRPIILSRQY